MDDPSVILDRGVKTQQKDIQIAGVESNANTIECEELKHPLTSEGCFDTTSILAPLPFTESSSGLNSPLEFIALTPRNTRQMILYVSPDALEPSATNPKSETDVELVSIFQNSSPNNNGPQRKSSVEDVSSYRSTTDLEQMGNAAYFSDLTAPGNQKANPRSVLTSNDDGLFSDLNSSWARSFKRTLFGLLIPNQQNLLVEDEKCLARLEESSKCGRLWNLLLPCCTNKSLKVDCPCPTCSQIIKFPKPILTPVLTRRDNRWFFGSKPPEDQDLLIKSEQSKNYQKFFQNP